MKPQSEIDAENKKYLINLFKAIQKSDLATIQNWVGTGFDLSVKDEKGRTLLDYIARYGDTQTLANLLESGFDVNAQDVTGARLIDSAVIYNRLDLVEFLIDKKADLSKGKNQRYSPLSQAIEYGRMTIAGRLIKAGVDPYAKDGTWNSAVEQIVATGDWYDFESLKGDGYDFINSTSKDGMTALHYAVRYRRDDLIEYLCSRMGDNCNLKNDKGQTALDVLLADVNEVESDFGKEKILKIAKILRKYGVEPTQELRYAKARQFKPEEIDLLQGKDYKYRGEKPVKGELYYPIDEENNNEVQDDDFFKKSNAISFLQNNADKRLTKAEVKETSPFVMENNLMEK